MDRSSSQHEFRLSENASSHTLHGLEVGKEYEIWINAQTRIGTGLRSGYVKTKTMTKSEFNVFLMLWKLVVEAGQERAALLPILVACLNRGCQTYFC